MDHTGRRIRFLGKVQGVGFRYTVLEVARSRGLGGWVRNVHDGSVEAHLYGSESAISRALSDLKDRRLHYIQEVQETPVQAPDPVGDFEIRL